MYLIVPTTKVTKSTVCYSHNVTVAVCNPGLWDFRLFTSDFRFLSFRSNKWDLDKICSMEISDFFYTTCGVSYRPGV